MNMSPLCQGIGRSVEEADGWSWVSEAGHCLPVCLAIDKRVLILHDWPAVLKAILASVLGPLGK